MVPFKYLFCTSFKDLNLFHLKGKPVRRLSRGLSQEGLRWQRSQTPAPLRIEKYLPPASGGHSTSKHFSYSIQLTI
jgi:hypothetical protein